MVVRAAAVVVVPPPRLEAMVGLAAEEVREAGPGLAVLAELWVVAGVGSRAQRLLPEAARQDQLQFPVAPQPFGFFTKEATR
jgi:hypothetical protein